MFLLVVDRTLSAVGDCGGVNGLLLLQTLFGRGTSDGAESRTFQVISEYPSTYYFQVMMNGTMSRHDILSMFRPRPCLAIFFCTRRDRFFGDAPILPIYCTYNAVDDVITLNLFP